MLEELKQLNRTRFHNKLKPTINKELFIHDKHLKQHDRVQMFHLFIH